MGAPSNSGSWVRHATTQADEEESAVPQSNRQQHGGSYQPGDMIASKYELQRVIGSGGMGAIWSARNVSLDTEVAVKLIRSDLASRQGAARLLVEAKAAARIDHPAIVRVYDFGTTEQGDPYIVMEAVEGESLADLLRRESSLPAKRAVPLLLPLVHALSAVHGRDIVHRDVKPENIILTSSDGGRTMPKLVDFGVAKLREPDGENLTREGSAVGSPQYMSPEQVRATETVDERSDVWSFSVVLYEVLTGNRPFEGRSEWELFERILKSEPVPITDLNVDDDALWTIISRGLAKRSSQRWPTMGAIGRALAEWAVEHGIETDVAGTSLAVQWLQDAPEESGSTPEAIPSRSDSGSASRPTFRPIHWVVLGVALGGALFAVGAALNRPTGTTPLQRLAITFPSVPKPIAEPTPSVLEASPESEPVVPSANPTPPTTQTAKPKGPPAGGPPASGPPPSSAKPRHPGETGIDPGF